MSTLTQLKTGLSSAWESVANGWRELRELADDAMTRFHPGHGSSGRTPAEHMGSPATRWGLLAAEVSERNGEIEVKLEAPGLDPGDFDVQVYGDIVVVRGEKKVGANRSHGNYYVMERAYGRFERALRLPAPVDDSGGSARYRHGVLTLKLPKAERPPSQRITVSARG